jgi:hypothetical protein
MWLILGSFWVYKIERNIVFNAFHEELVHEEIMHMVKPEALQDYDYKLHESKPD